MCDLRCDLDSRPLRGMLARLPLRAVLPRHPLQMLHPRLPLRVLLLGLPFGVVHPRLLIGVKLPRLPAGRSFQRGRLKASAHRLQSDGQLRGVAALAQVAGMMVPRAAGPARDWARPAPSRLASSILRYTCFPIGPSACFMNSALRMWHKLRAPSARLRGCAMSAARVRAALGSTGTRRTCP